MMSTSTLPRFAYIISRRIDPIFALFIGFSAATLRIRREEMEKGHSGDLGEIAGKLVRRSKGLWGGVWEGFGDEEEKVEGRG